MIWLIFLVLLGACFAAGASGALFPPGQWYRELSKPSWTPPDWVFPVTWTTLYILMAYAGARVAVAPSSGLAIAIWALQMTLNGLWTPVFFGLGRLKLALQVLGALWLSVLAAMIALWSVDAIAGLCFVPYLIWVSIAGALNYSVMTRNPQAAT